MRLGPNHPTLDSDTLHVVSLLLGASHDSCFTSSIMTIKATELLE